MDLLLRAVDHEVTVLTPDAVVGLVLEDRQFHQVLPAVVGLHCQLDQPMLQLRCPGIATERRIDNVAVPFPDLQFTLDDDLVGDESPLLGSEVLAKDDQHQTLANVPPSRLQPRVDPVVKLVVDLLEGAVVHELADLLPVVTVNPLLGHDSHLLLHLEGTFGGFGLRPVQPLLVDLDAGLVARSQGNFCKVGELRVERKI